MEARYKASPLYKYLTSLKHSRKTDLANGTINNPDAIILLFWIVSEFELDIKTLADFSMDWKKSNTLARNYFASNQSGNTGVDFNSRKLFGNPCSSWPKEPKPYWFRTERPHCTMVLAADGYLRLSALLKDMESVLPRPWQ